MRMPALRNWSLQLRMVLAICLLSIVTFGFLASIWVVFFAVSALVFEPYVAPYVAGAVTLAMLAGIGYLEYRQVRSVEQRVGARHVSSEAYPDLHAAVTRVAHQLDVPVPIIAVSDSPAPEAVVVGFRPSETHLVLSQGTLDAVDGDELEALIAHELAHVANRDAMVMTALSVPVVLADGLRARLRVPEGAQRTAPRAATTPVADRESYEALYGEDGEWRAATTDQQTQLREEAGDKLLRIVFLLVATVSGFAARSVVAVFSRARERTADRTAVAVTGSPAALASTLRTLEAQITETPDRDLRAVSSVSSLSILPIEPEPVEAIRLGPAGERNPFLWSVRAPVRRIARRFSRTHPPTEQRLDELAALERERE